jgi:hypothetical protein
MSHRSLFFVWVVSIASVCLFALVADANSNAANGNSSVSATAASGYDGPAQLPIATVASSMAESRRQDRSSA